MPVLPADERMVHELKQLKKEAQKANELLDMIYSALVDLGAKDNPLGHP